MRTAGFKVALLHCKPICCSTSTRTAAHGRIVQLQQQNHGIYMVVISDLNNLWIALKREREGLESLSNLAVAGGFMAGLGVLRKPIRPDRLAALLLPHFEEDARRAG